MSKQGDCVIAPFSTDPIMDIPLADNMLGITHLKHFCASGETGSYALYKGEEIVFRFDFGPKSTIKSDSKISSKTFENGTIHINAACGVAIPSIGSESEYAVTSSFSYYTKDDTATLEANEKLNSTTVFSFHISSQSSNSWVDIYGERIKVKLIDTIAFGIKFDIHLKSGEILENHVFYGRTGNKQNTLLAIDCNDDKIRPVEVDLNEVETIKKVSDNKILYPVNSRNILKKINQDCVFLKSDETTGFIMLGAYAGEHNESESFFFSSYCPDSLGNKKLESLSIRDVFGDTREDNPLLWCININP